MNFGKTINSCRMCDSRELYTFLDLGFLPPADKILKKEDLNSHEIYFPLKVAQCTGCGLTQLMYVVNPELLYGETYSYESSITETGKKHFFAMAASICEMFHLHNDFAVDIGSNVGVLLEGFKNNGLKVLGIDPAPRIVDIANKRGIETWQGFMNSSIAEKIAREKGKAKVITATNVFAHIDDKRDLLASIKLFLDDYGVFVIEAPYLIDLLDNVEYDTIYLDHLEYLSVKPLTLFFQKQGLEVFHIEKYAIHGNSIRVFVSWKNRYRVQSSVQEFLDTEEKKGIYTKRVLDDFSQKVREHKDAFIDLIHQLKKQRKKIVGISAPAKGNTILNYCKIHDYHLEYMTEKSKIKVGHFTPGMHIPIIEEENLIKDQVDYGIIFAWNFADEIMKNNQAFLEQGGKFIIPIPYPRIVDSNNNNVYNESAIEKKMDGELFGATIKKVDPVHIDERGIIADLVNEPLSHVGMISTEKDAIRGSHYHKNSRQHSYILSGTFEVVLAPYDNTSHQKKVLLHAGELITIPPFVIHQFKAIERAVMINMETQSRAGTGYEDDVFRVTLEN